ncbi:hypothetical protein [Aeromicrobium sp. 179-A 4D2 NHS]|uniref:hypothetical protein n=1 Tax=Aeromicrobium sp. 179-A 4D2 NHS TaxID=3142375 RepID=UPI0039A0932A
MTMQWSEEFERGLESGEFTPEIEARMRSMYKQMRALVVTLIGMAVGSITVSVAIGFIVNPWAGAFTMLLAVMGISRFVDTTVTAKHEEADQILRDAEAHTSTSEDTPSS